MPSNSCLYTEDLSIDLLLESPFLGKFLAQITKIPDSSMAGSSTWKLDEHLNFCLFYQLFSSEDHLHKNASGSIKHQILHLLLAHPLRMSEYADPMLFQIAADLEVEQYLSEQEQSAELSRISQLIGLDQSGNLYLDQLYKALVQYTSEQSLPMLSSFYHSHLRQHDFWSSLKHYPRQEQVIIRSKLHRLLRRHLQQHSPDAFLPRGQALVEQIKEQIAPPQAAINWQRELRRFALRSRGSRRQSSLRRPSRRYGTWPGSYRKHQQQLIIVIDTSASLKIAEIRQFFRQIDLLWQAGTSLTIIECDDQVRRHYAYRGQMPEQIKGRGQTRFAPALQYATEHFSFDGLIYFSDGYGTSFNLSIDYPLLWVISSAGIETAHQNWNKLPGNIVKMI